MTSVPRSAISAAFNSADFPAQFGLSRPEDVYKWVRAQDAKVMAKQATAASRAEALEKSGKEKSHATKRSQTQPIATKRSQTQTMKSGED
jgi:hypothetical protein